MTLLQGLLTAAGQPRENDAMRQEARELRRQVSRSIDHISALQRESLAAAHDAQLGVSQLVAYIDLRDHDSLSSTAAHGRGERAESVRSAEVDLVKTENALLVSGQVDLRCTWHGAQKFSQLVGSREPVKWLARNEFSSCNIFSSWVFFGSILCFVSWRRCSCRVRGAMAVCWWPPQHCQTRCT